MADNESARAPKKGKKRRARKASLSPGAEDQGQPVSPMGHRTASGNFRKHASKPKFATFESEDFDQPKGLIAAISAGSLRRMQLKEHDGHRHGHLSFRDRLNDKNDRNTAAALLGQVLIFIITCSFMTGFGTGSITEWTQGYFASIPSNDLTSEKFSKLSPAAFKWFDLPGRPAVDEWDSETHDDDVVTAKFKVLSYEQTINGETESTAASNLLQEYGTSCHRSMTPGKMGNFLRYHGHQFKLNLVWAEDLVSWTWSVNNTNTTSNSTGAWDVDSISYDDHKCFVLWEAHVVGIVTILCSCVTTALVLLLALSSYLKLGSSRYVVVAKLPIYIGTASGFFCFLQGCLSLMTAAALARVRGKWADFGFSWYFMPLFGMADLALCAHLGHITSNFHESDPPPALENVAEGLWGRKVEGGGPEGFNEESLGIELVKHNGRVVIKSVRGFATSKGALDKSIQEQGIKDYWANNVQERDVFLGIMTRKDITIRRAKTPKELLEDKKALSTIDPNTLMFKREAPEHLRGKYISDDAYVMLGKDYRWIKKKNHKVYKWLTPHIDPSLDDAEDMIKQAIHDANDQDNPKRGPFWLILWRVNTEGVKETLFPPDSMTGAEWDAFDYEAHDALIEFAPNSVFTRSMGLDLYDLNLSTQRSGREETEGVSILGSAGYSKSMGLNPDDIICGINYVPLTKLMTAHLLGRVLQTLPLPYVLNVAKKKSVTGTAAVSNDAKKFFEMLLLFAMVGTSTVLLMAASGSTEWVTWDPDHSVLNSLTGSPSYQIGLFFSLVSKDANVRYHNKVDALLDEVVWDSDFLTEEQRNHKIATRFFLFLAMCLGGGCVYGIGICILIGVSHVKMATRLRIKSITCLCMFIQGVLSLVSLSVWTTVHSGIVDKEPNCIIQYEDLRGNHIVEWGDSDDHDHTFGNAVCLSKFSPGLSFQGLVLSAALAFFVFVDTLMGLAMYPENQSFEQLAREQVHKELEAKVNEELEREEAETKEE